MTMPSGETRVIQALRPLVRELVEYVHISNEVVRGMGVGRGRSRPWPEVGSPPGENAAA